VGAVDSTKKTVFSCHDLTETAEKVPPPKPVDWSCDDRG
jgi:hypothetical protein